MGVDLRDWKFWVVIAVVVIIIIFVLSCFTTFRKSKPRYESDEDSEFEEERPKKPKRYRRRSRRPPVREEDDSMEYMQVSMRPVETRVFKTPTPLPVSEVQSLQENPLSSRDAMPPLTVVSSTAPPPMKELDLTPAIPSFLTGPRPNNDDGARPQSKGEAAARIAMEKVYGVPFNKERPAWLINPKTGKRLELDGVNHDLKMAFEFHGEQHYIFKPYFYANYDQFAAAVERDHVKLDICDQHGYYVITIPYNIPHDQMVEYIRYNDPTAMAMRKARQAEIYGH